MSEDFKTERNSRERNTTNREGGRVRRERISSSSNYTTGNTNARPRFRRIEPTNGNNRNYNDHNNNENSYNNDYRTNYSTRNRDNNYNREGNYNRNNRNYNRNYNSNREQGYNNTGNSYNSYKNYNENNSSNNSTSSYNNYNDYNRSNSENKSNYNRSNSNVGNYNRRDNNYSRSNYNSSNRYSNNYNNANKPYQQHREYRNQNENNNGEGFNSYHKAQGYNNYNSNNSYNSRPNNRYDQNPRYNSKKRIEYKEKNYDPDALVRLNKYLANAGVCSRRDADKFIEAGVVTVNGNVVKELGSKVKRSDVIHFHDDLISMEKKVYILLNKPKGYVTTSDDPQNRKTVMDLIQNACPERVYPIGRLDRNTTGVLLFTNDGDLASKLTHPKFMKKKIYQVQLDKKVTATDILQIAEGIELEDGKIKADAIDYIDPTDKKEIGIEIHSGKNRIVRRIFEHFGYRVVKLDRVYFAGLTKKNVRRGDWRFLSEKEVNMLQMGAFE